jgi:hypothetical protein
MRRGAFRRANWALHNIVRQRKRAACRGSRIQQRRDDYELAGFLILVVLFVWIMRAIL